MNNERERLSALVDQEMDRDESDTLLTRICERPDLRETWARYHLIGDALRGESGALRGRSLAEGVWARLEREERGGLERPLSPAVTHRRPSWLRASYGYFALAASMLGVAILLGRGALSPTPPQSVHMASVAGPQYQYYLRDRNEADWNLDEPQVEDRLNRYLEAHRAYSPVASVKGVVPYVSLAGYEAHP